MRNFDIPNIPRGIVKDVYKNLHLIDQNLFMDDFQKLTTIYAQSDKILDFLSPYFSCKKGCSHCCNYDVLITEFEARYINLKSGAKFTRNKTFTRHNDTPCPFLKKGECSIYKYRPFICRTYHSLDKAEKCKLSNVPTKIWQYGTEQSDYGNELFLAMSQFIFLANQNYESSRKDIRNFFL